VERRGGQEKGAPLRNHSLPRSDKERGMQEEGGPRESAAITSSSCLLFFNLSVRRRINGIPRRASADTEGCGRESGREGDGAVHTAADGRGREASRTARGGEARAAAQDGEGRGMLIGLYRSVGAFFSSPDPFFFFFPFPISRANNVLTRGPIDSNKATPATNPGAQPRYRG
jgi:hypothetical protein